MLHHNHSTLLRKVPEFYILVQIVVPFFFQAALWQDSVICHAFLFCNLLFMFYGLSWYLRYLTMCSVFPCVNYCLFVCVPFLWLWIEVLHLLFMSCVSWSSYWYILRLWTVKYLFICIYISRKLFTLHPKWITCTSSEHDDSSQNKKSKTHTTIMHTSKGNTRKNLKNK